MTISARPTNAEIRQEQDPTRRAILAAMIRLLDSMPTRVPAGALTVRHLAAEANVGRHHLYQSCRDLRDRFQALSAGHTGIDVEEAREKVARAQSQVARLKALQKRTYDEMRMWKATCGVFERAINVLQEELRQEQLKSERLKRKVDGAAEVAKTVIPIRPR